MTEKEHTIRDTVRPILAFLESRPALSARELAKIVGFNVSQFYDFKNGKRNDFPEKHIWPLVVELCRYGFEAGGWRFRYDEDVHYIFIETPLDQEVETIEHEESTRTWVEHRVPMSRSIIGEEYELIDFLNKC